MDRSRILLPIITFLLSIVTSVTASFAQDPGTVTTPPNVCPPAISMPDVYEVGENQAVFGTASCHVVREEDTLLDIARFNGIGYNEIVAANPEMDPWVPPLGKQVVFPSSWIMPGPLREGIVINLAEMRLYYRFRKDGKRYVATYPLGIGREGDDTPVGRFAISEKEVDPEWIPPKSILAEKPGLPRVVPPGPDNPLGRYKMRLGKTTYLIHGTNKPFGVGRRVSHGCIRLYPEDIEELFELTPTGTPVETVYMPVKAAVVDGRVYVEVHDDYLDKVVMIDYAINEVDRAGGIWLVDPGRLYDALERKSGMPVDVTADEPEEGPGRKD